MNLIYSTDGGLTFKEAPEGIRVKTDDPLDGGMELLLNITHEGLIIDSFGDDGIVQKTFSATFDELEEDFLT